MKNTAVKVIVTGATVGVALLSSACSERKNTEGIQEVLEKVDHHDHEHGAHGHDHGHGSHDHGHGHDAHPGGHRHHGIVIPFLADGKQAGYAELKLHDDKGDLELWLTKDEAGTQPFDFALNTVITVTFPQLENKTVSLNIRNSAKNEDEDGKGNIRSNKTNYFIFPGETGADASFLLGKEFVSDAVISFGTARQKFTTETFELKPHTH